MEKIRDFDLGEFLNQTKEKISSKIKEGKITTSNDIFVEVKNSCSEQTKYWRESWLVLTQLKIENIPHISETLSLDVVDENKEKARKALIEYVNKNIDYIELLFKN